MWRVANVLATAGLADYEQPGSAAPPYTTQESHTICHVNPDAPTTMRDPHSLESPDVLQKYHMNILAHKELQLQALELELTILIIALKYDYNSYI